MAASLGAESERWCIVLVVVERDGSLVLVVEPTRVAVPCPQCGELSRRQHSRYERHPLDLPWRGKTVRMRVHSRRWFCDAPTCPRKIFAERFDGALARYARRTDGTTDLLTTFALQAGGEGGARLARKIGVPISPDTLLRILHSLTMPIVSVARGCWVSTTWPCAASNAAMARCCSISRRTDRSICSTIALPTCSPTGSAATLASRSSSAIAPARTPKVVEQGAPDAIQVADRFHLSANAGAALDEVCAAVDGTSNTWSSATCRAAGPDTDRAFATAQPNTTEPGHPTNTSQRTLGRGTCSARRRYGIARIAREMGMHRRTVRRYLATPVPPRNRPTEHPKPSGLTSPTLQPFVDYLQGRWQAGCTNVAQLQRELEAQGYQGSYSLLMQALQPWRGPRPPPEPGRGRRRGRPRVKRVNVRWLCLRPPAQLEPYELDALHDILEGDERLALGTSCYSVSVA